ncbi:MAG: hypothetical protein WAL20_13125, partial [Rhodomicrobium sp.]
MATAKAGEGEAASCGCFISRGGIASASLARGFSASFTGGAIFTATGGSFAGASAALISDPGLMTSV